MVPLKRRLPSVQGSKTAGSTIVYDLATGNLRYLSMLIRLTDGASASRSVSDIISAVRIKINGRQVQRILGSQLEYLRDHLADGFSVHSVGNDPFLKLRFAELNRRTFQGEDALGWGMSNVSSFQIEIDIASGVTASELDFDGFYQAELVQSENIGSIVQIEQFTVNANGAGKVTIPWLPRDMPYYKLHLVSDKVDEVLVTLNGNVVFELTKDEATADQSTDLLNPDSTHFTVPFDQRARVNDYLDVRGASEFTIELQMASGAAPFQLVAEKIGKVGTLD